jgi:hypothetical protein
MSLTEQEKRIYNTYLQASRKGKPFTHRKNFNNINNDVYVYLKKLSSFFNHNPSVNIHEYFEAPYTYYNDEDYFDIGFFITPRAIKCYSLYKQKQEKQNPDNTDTIQQCKECCVFIYKFCKENNITLDEYSTKIIGTTPAFLQHLREHKINFYTLHGLEIEKNIFSEDNDLLDFFIKDFKLIYNETRINFLKSKQLKRIIRESIKIIRDKLNKTTK